MRSLPNTCREQGKHPTAEVVGRGQPGSRCGRFLSLKCPRDGTRGCRLWCPGSLTLVSRGDGFVGGSSSSPKLVRGWPGAEAMSGDHGGGVVELPGQPVRLVRVTAEADGLASCLPPPLQDARCQGEVGVHLQDPPGCRQRFQRCPVLVLQLLRISAGPSPAKNAAEGARTEGQPARSPRSGRRAQPRSAIAAHRPGRPRRRRRSRAAQREGRARRARSRGIGRSLRARAGPPWGPDASGVR